MTPTLCCSWHSFEGSLHSVKECGLQKNILWSRSYNHHRSACGAIFQFCYFGLFGSDKPTLKILNICRWPTIPANEWRESQRLRTTSSDRDLPRRKSSCSCTLQFPLSTLQLQSSHNCNWRYFNHTSSCYTILLNWAGPLFICRVQLIASGVIVLPSSTSSCSTILQAQLSRASGPQWYLKIYRKLLLKSLCWWLWSCWLARWLYRIGWALKGKYFEIRGNQTCFNFSNISCRFLTLQLANETREGWYFEDTSGSVCIYILNLYLYGFCIFNTWERGLDCGGSLMAHCVHVFVFCICILYFCIPTPRTILWFPSWPTCTFSLLHHHYLH